MTRKGRAVLLAGAAFAAMGPLPAIAQPLPAIAQTAHEAELEARLKMLEQAVSDLRGELDATKTSQQATAAQASTAQSQQTATDVKIAKLEARPVSLAEGFRDGATTIKLGGYIKTIASFTQFNDGSVAGNSSGRDFYLPSATPIGGTRTRVNEISAKQSRFWLNLQTDVAGHALKGYFEGDFITAPGTQGSQRTTNGYNFAMRRAFVQFDKLLIGQDWSTFQYVAALPESTDFVGATEGTVFVRQPLVRYTVPLGKQFTLAVAAENPETASAAEGTPTLVENDDDHIPDFVARLQYASSFGELSVAGIGRQVSAVNGTQHANTSGYGVSAAGKVNLNSTKTADFRFMATYGHGIGRYVGLNFAPDAILVPGSNDLRDVNVFAAFAAVHVPLASSVRVNLIGSYQRVDYPDGFTATAFNAFNKESWSGAGNIFYTPVKGFDLGVEYRHGRREIGSGASGTLDRVEFAAKYGF